MEEPPAPRGEAQAAHTEDRPHGEIDWQAIERSPEFQELIRRRRAFVLPGTIFFLGWYMAFILVTAYAVDFMSERVYEGLTVGYVLALTQFLMVLVLGIMYLRRADKVYDPLAQRAIERFADHGGGETADGPLARESEPPAGEPTTTTEETTR